MSLASASFLTPRTEYGSLVDAERTTEDENDRFEVEKDDS